MAIRRTCHLRSELLLLGRCWNLGNTVEFDVVVVRIGLGLLFLLMSLFDLIGESYDSKTISDRATACAKPSWTMHKVVAPFNFHQRVATSIISDADAGFGVGLTL